MQKKLLKHASTVLATTAAVVGTLAGPTLAQAASVATTGLAGTNATVTDTTGQPVTADYSKWGNYQVNYQWSIANGLALTAGDTATVTLPSGLVATSDLSIPLTNHAGQVVGTFTLAAGATTGTLTFNQLATTADVDRTGTLSFYTQGTAGSNDVANNWVINKIGWIAGRNSAGAPTLLTWNVAFNAASLTLGNVTITDTLGSDQVYVPGSVTASAGYYDDNGNFVSDGQTVTPSVTSQANQLTLGFTNITTAVNLTYQTVPTVMTAGTVWTNTAAISGGATGQVSAQIAYGGTGSENGQVATPTSAASSAASSAAQPATGMSSAATSSVASSAAQPATGTSSVATSSAVSSAARPATGTSSTATSSVASSVAQPATGTSSASSSTASSAAQPATGTSSTATSSTASSAAQPATGTSSATTSSVVSSATQPATSTNSTATSSAAPAVAQPTPVTDPAATVTPASPVTNQTGTMQTGHASAMGTAQRVTPVIHRQGMDVGTPTSAAHRRRLTRRVTTKTSRPEKSLSVTPTAAPAKTPAHPLVATHAADRATVTAHTPTRIKEVAAPLPTQNRLPQTNERPTAGIAGLGSLLLAVLGLLGWKRRVRR